MSTPQMVPMLAPDGSGGMIPQDRVNDAIAHGGKLGVYMRAPDGSTGIIPRENIVSALGHGGKLLQDSQYGQTHNEQEQNAPKTGVWDTVKGVAKAVPALVGGAASMVDSALSANPYKQMQPALQAVQSMQQGNAATPDDAGLIERGAMTIGPLAGVDTPALAQASRQRDLGGAIVASAPAVAMAAAPELMRQTVKVAPVVGEAVSNIGKGALADRMAEVPPGSQFSRQAVLNDAQAHGVNLDLAQATESPVLNAAKKANRYSLAAQNTYDTAATKNLNALGEWADSEASRYAPAGGGREVVGPQIQRILGEHLENRQNMATQLYNELDKNVGNVTPDASSIYDKAQQIVAENKDYYDKNPALKQSQAWRIVNDLADRGKVAPEAAATTRPEGFETFSPDAAPKVKSGPTPDSWTDLQKLRTDLMSEYRSKDIVGTRAEGWLKQLTGTIDDSMTGAGSGMTGENLATFRNANDIWNSIKSTYDNPQSPYYHAVRSQYPSQVPAMLSRGTPELATAVRNTLGDLQGPFQRQFVETLLNGKDGVSLDLNGLNARLKRVPQDHLESMLGEEGAASLRMLGKVAQKVTADANPSGTAKVGIPAAEVSGFFHNPIAGSAELGAQYGGAKLMNSRWLLEHLTGSEGGVPTGEPTAPRPSLGPISPTRAAVPPPAQPVLDSQSISATIEPQQGVSNAESNGPRGSSASQEISEPRRASAPADTGTATSVRIPGEEHSYTANYQVRELGDVQASHSGVSFQPNPKYALANDRDYNNPLNRGKILTGSLPGKFEPSYHITDNPDATNGPIVIDSEGHALGGNGRAMILDRVYRYNPDGAQAYKDLLIKKAGQFGLDPDAIAKMDRPVLVRHISDDAFMQSGSKQSAITDFNKTGTAELTPNERAIADSRRVSTGTLEDISSRLDAKGEKATVADILGGNSGSQILERFINDGVISPQERAAYQTADGLTAAGKERISKLMIGRFYQDAAQIDTTPPEIRNKLERLAAPLSRAESVEGWDITPQIKEAINLLEDTRSHGAKNPGYFLKHSSLFGDEKYSPEALTLAKHLQFTPPTVLSKFVNQYADSAVKSGMLAFDEPVTQKQAWKNAFGEGPK